MRVVCEGCVGEPCRPTRPRVGASWPPLIKPAGRIYWSPRTTNPFLEIDSSESSTPKMAKTPVVASKKSAKVAKAAAAAPKKDGKKKRSTKRVESYGTYIYKVLKQVHPGESPACASTWRGVLHERPFPPQRRASPRRRWAS